jgi:hypothetical protein
MYTLIKISSLLNIFRRGLICTNSKETFPGCAVVFKYPCIFILCGNDTCNIPKNAIAERSLVVKYYRNWAREVHHWSEHSNSCDAKHETSRFRVLGARHECRCPPRLPRVGHPAEEKEPSALRVSEFLTMRSGSWDRRWFRCCLQPYVLKVRRGLHSIFIEHYQLFR